MSRFKNEVLHLQSHVRTLRFGLLGLILIALAVAVGWWSAPTNLTIHVPPDLRTGSVRKWWEVPPESVYAFTLYLFQRLQSWPNDGEADYAANIQKLGAYLTPACKAFLEKDFTIRRERGELRRRTRGISEIPGRGYGDDPMTRVRVVSRHDWVVTLDVTADEYYESARVKRAMVRYPIKVTKMDVDPQRNPFGLAIDCYESTPERIVAGSSESEQTK